MKKPAHPGEYIPFVLQKSALDSFGVVLRHEHDEVLLGWTRNHGVLLALLVYEKLVFILLKAEGAK